MDPLSSAPLDLSVGPFWYPLIQRLCPAPPPSRVPGHQFFFCVLDVSITDENVEACLDQLQARVLARMSTPLDEAASAIQQVIVTSYYVTISTMTSLSLL